MKKLVFTDLHLGLGKNSDIWLNLSVSFIKEILDKCMELNIDTIYCLRRLLP
jgi:DNA repair exonuclease SbcCD nuclease subunit